VAKETVNIVRRKPTLVIVVAMTAESMHLLSCNVKLWNERLRQASPMAHLSA
jgi:hypothetical protein